ncbi:MAG: hypothetical protein CVV35_07190 [Methanomicrobiales archaeon HGW-Methanomicrobiales-6]|nr:MAG: hypothetical protein CVV35_07190 [Methanomicrobiales archaeon HGW-Methanomicrobiales-6]
MLKLRFSHLWCSCSCRPGNRTPNHRSLHTPSRPQRTSPGPRLRPLADVAGVAGGSISATTVLRRRSPSRGSWNAARRISDFPVRRTFERVKVEIGRCDICGAGKAVYRSREAQATVCEERLPRRGRSSSTEGARCDGSRCDWPKGRSVSTEGAKNWNRSTEGAGVSRDAGAGVEYGGGGEMNEGALSVVC